MGTAHGWGVCGRYITRGLARPARVRRIRARWEAGLVGDALELGALRALRAPAELQSAGRGVELDQPVLQCVLDAELTPMRPRLRGRHTVGYTFFENTQLR